MKHFLFYGLVIVMACGMYSCKCSKKDATPDTPAVSVADELTNKRWQLVEIMGRPVTYSSEDNRIAYIQFRADGTVSGSLSCNTFTGNYTANPEILQIRFSNLVNTLKMCLDMEIENELSKVLQNADNYNVNGDKLTLNRARMAPLARFEAVYLR